MTILLWIFAVFGAAMVLGFCWIWVLEPKDLDEIKTRLGSFN